ncbi:unnamed protein product, partial [Sphacelaria rigidula]
PLPEEIASTPSADLRVLFREVSEQSEAEILPPAAGFHRGGVPAGPRALSPLLDTGDARINDLSLGLYAPSSHALVIKVRVT